MSSSLYNMSLNFIYANTCDVYLTPLFCGTQRLSSQRDDDEVYASFPCLSLLHLTLKLLQHLQSRQLLVCLNPVSRSLSRDDAFFFVLGLGLTIEPKSQPWDFDMKQEIEALWHMIALSLYALQTVGSPLRESSEKDRTQYSTLRRSSEMKAVLRNMQTLIINKPWHQAQFAVLSFFAQRVNAAR